MYVTHTVIISINDPTTSEKSITAETVGKVSVSLVHLVIKLYASQKHVFDRQKMPNCSLYCFPNMNLESSQDHVSLDYLR